MPSMIEILVLTEVKAHRNAVPMKELLPVRRSAWSFKYANMYLFFCFCSNSHLYYAVNKTFYRRTNVRPQKISQIRCSAVLRWITMRILFLWRWEWIIVTYNLSHRTSEAVSVDRSTLIQIGCPCCDYKRTEVL